MENTQVSSPSQQFDVSSDQHPFAQTYQDDHYQPNHGSRWKSVILVSLCVLLLVCSGLGGLAFFAVRRMAGPRAGIRPPERTVDSFANDAAEFNDSLQTYATVQCPDPELCNFVDQTLQDSAKGIEIPLHTELFIEAVGRSNLNTRPLSLIDRISLRRSLRLSKPVCENVWGHHRVLQVRLGPSPGFASVDLFYYGELGQAESIQWFLAKEDGQWSIYDWQMMEHGRRASDEYAAYLLGSESLVPGYYDAMVLVADAQTLWSDGETEAAKRKLRKAERVKMLSADRPCALMSCAYGWMEIEEYEEALRVFASVPAPNKRWGVWPSVAVCHYSLGDNEAALAAIEKAERQSPSHPNVLWMQTQIHDTMGNRELAANAAIKALQLSPQDASAANYVIGYGRPEDIPELLDALTEMDEEYLWRSFIYNASPDVDWVNSLAESLSNGKQLPAGAREIIAGNAAWSEDKTELAATHFLAAKKAASQDYLRKMAISDLVTLRTEMDQYEQLFAESDDLSVLVTEMFDLAVMDELYADSQTLLDAIEANANLPMQPMLHGLLGWCRFDQEQYAAAGIEFEAALVAMETLANEAENDEKNDESKSDVRDVVDAQMEGDPESRITSVKYYITQSMLEEGRPVDALKRFPDDGMRIQQVGDFLTLSANRGLIRDFLGATEGNTDNAVQLQRQRILARAAFSKGKVEECDEHHLMTLKLAAEVYEQDEWYRVRQIVMWRARELAWNRSWRPAANIRQEVEEFDGRSVHIESFAREATRLFDTKTLTACLDEMARNPASDATLSTVLWHHAIMLEEQGELEAAIEMLQASVSKTDPEDGWELSVRKSKLAYMLLRANDLEAALPYLETIEDGVPASTTVDLFKGNLVAVLESLRKIDREAVVTDWFRETEHEARLLQCKDLPGYDDLMNEFSMRIRYRPGLTAGTLYFEPTTKIDQDFLRRAFVADGDNVGFQSVRIEQDGNSSRHAVVASSATQKVLFQWSTDEYDVEHIPGEIRSHFESPVTQLRIVILDQQSQSTKRLFGLAESACEDAFAFKWESESVVWFGDDLAKQLYWNDRLPVPEAPVDAGLFVKTSEATESPVDDRLDFDEWQEILDDSGGKADVVIEVHQGIMSELISAVLTEVQEDDYRLCVVVKSNAATDDMVQSGRKFYCGLNSIRQAETK